MNETKQDTFAVVCERTNAFPEPGAFVLVNAKKVSDYFKTTDQYKENAKQYKAQVDQYPIVRHMYFGSNLNAIPDERFDVILRVDRLTESGNALMAMITIPNFGEMSINADDLTVVKLHKANPKAITNTTYIDLLDPKLCVRTNELIASGEECAFSLIEEFDESELGIFRSNMITNYAMLGSTKYIQNPAYANTKVESEEDFLSKMTNEIDAGMSTIANDREEAFSILCMPDDLAFNFMLDEFEDYNTVLISTVMTIVRQYIGERVDVSLDDIKQMVQMVKNSMPLIDLSKIFASVKTYKTLLENHEINR